MNESVRMQPRIDEAAMSHALRLASSYDVISLVAGNRKLPVRVAGV
jgi:hypothetical protein